MTTKYQKLAFYSTTLFVMIACASLDAFITDFSGGKPWARPIKAGFFLTCVCLVLFFAAPYPDDYFGAIPEKILTPEDFRSVSFSLLFELMADGVLAEVSRWFTTLLVSDTEKTDSLFSSASWYVMPLTIYMRQPNLRARIDYMTSVLMA
jgi:hypothetical protein